jgi:hypothetical protein
VAYYNSDTEKTNYIVGFTPTASQLIGATITQEIYDDWAFSENGEYTMRYTLSNGHILFPSKDYEENGAGVFMIWDGEKFCHPKFEFTEELRKKP